MDIRIVAGVEGAKTAQGHVVVVDVIRAFTTAAYAFDAGISEIELVATVEEAMARPGFRMGEVGGRSIPGFDYNNSPSGLIGRALSGRAVQRTSSGTQCVAAARAAESLWLGSLVVASSTVRALKGKELVTLVVSGMGTSGGDPEDMACALYLKSLLLGEAFTKEEAVSRVAYSPNARKLHPEDTDQPLADLECCTAVDRFDFAMQVAREGGRLLARTWR